MKSMWMLFSLLLVTSTQALTITSLNLQWFGRGGQLEGSRQDEYRSQRLLEFLTREMKASDVYVFQEVVDVALIAKLFPHLDCHTHDTTNRRMQHVVLCADASIIISKHVDRASSLNRFGLRPTPMIKVKDHDGEELMIAGVHLKSGKESGQTRLDQLKKLQQSQELGPKMVLVGDFNTYDKKDTGLEHDDIVLMSHILNPIGFTKIDNKRRTHLGYNKRVFDWAWTKGLKRQARLQVVGPCDQKSVAKPFKSFGFFRRFISDHCALQVSL